MAMKKDMTKEQLRAKKNNDAAVYKVMIALVLLCGALLGLRSLRSYYSTVEGFSVLYDRTPAILIAGLVIAVVAAVVGIFVKVRGIRLVAPWVLIAGLLIAATGWTMRLSGVNDFDFLYYLCFAVLLQYIIFQLYRWEFFLFSLSTVTAGGVFFSFSHGIYWTSKNILLVIALALVLVGTTIVTNWATHNKGYLSLGRSRVHLFPAKSAPILIYIANILWLVCAIAIPFLGGLFAYYCMFAAIAVEFIAAVYYTFQLN